MFLGFMLPKVNTVEYRFSIQDRVERIDFDLYSREEETNVRFDLFQMLPFPLVFSIILH